MFVVREIFWRAHVRVRARGRGMVDSLITSGEEEGAGAVLKLLFASWTQSVRSVLMRYANTLLHVP